jgi:predicted secreted protein
MKWTSVLAIYFLIFCFTAFLLLPFGVKRMRRG